MVSPERFSLFLTPCEPDFLYLDSIIRKISATCNASPFEPHVTLYSGSCTDCNLLREAAAAAVQDVTPFSLEIAGIGFSTDYFKTLFVEFGENEIIRHIHDRFKQALPEASSYRMIPHLSLLYQAMPIEEKEALARSIFLERGKITFCSVKTVTPPEEGWHNTAAWRTRFSIGL